MIAGKEPTAMHENIFIYYTNDLHSRFDYWPQVVHYIKNMRKKREASFLMDVGDHVDRVHPIAEAFMGKANVALLNDAGYDVVTLGNNEGITLSHDDLFHLYDEANFEVVCTNLNSLTTKSPNWLLSKVIKKTPRGTRIGILGLTAPFNAFYHLLHWHVAYPHATLENNIQQLKKEVDIIILLSHLGLNDDKEIARQFNEIDVIIGGHTHHLLREGVMVNQTLITAAGKHCAYVGEVHLKWDHKNQQLVDKTAYTTNVTMLSKDVETEKKLTTLNKQADDILNETIVHIDQPLEVDWFKETEIIRQLTETLQTWTKADFSMLNAGLLLDEFQAGNVTLKDVHRICPHPINPCVVEVTGNELLEIVRVSLTSNLITFPLEGYGFRGKVIGKIVFAGLTVETEKNKNGELFAKRVLDEEEALQKDATYTLATADTFTFGHLFPEIAKSRSKKFFMPEFMRDLLTYTLKNKFN